jgi:hypothetical protein
MSDATAWGADIHTLVGMVHQLDKRVAVLEAKLEAQEGRTAAIEGVVHDTQDSVQEVLSVLREHVDQENKDRIKLMGVIVMTLLSIVGFAATLLLNHLLSK